MIKSTRLRSTLSASTILAAGLLVVVAPAQAQNLPDTGNVSVSTSGLSGGAPGSTNPGFSTSGAAGAQTLRVDLKDNRTILNWGGAGFNVAAGNTIDFKDARATAGVTGRTDNIAVLNRDLSGSTSNILGTIKSDPNVAVYLLNQSGILFGSNAVVNTGAFFAGTSNLSDDNDFLNAATRLRFSGSTGGTITANAGSQFTTAASASSNGGRMGDLVIMGSQVLFRGTAGNATSGGAAGDVALIAASDAAITNTPGSPLSIQIYSGSSLYNGIEVGSGSTVRGKNVILAYGMNGYLSGGQDYNVNIFGNLVATSAQATDQGVILAAGNPAGTVTMDLNAISGLGTIHQTGTITSAKNVLSSAIDHKVDGAIVAAGDVTFYDFVDSDSANGTITGANVNFGQITHTLGKVTATGNITSTGGNGILQFGGGAQAAGDITFDGQWFTVGAAGAQVGGALKITALSLLELGGAVTAGSVDIKTNADVQLSNSITATGPVKLVAGNATISGNIGAGNDDVDIETTGDLTIDRTGADFRARKLVSGGAMSVTAGSILLHDVTVRDDLIVNAPNGLAQIVNAKTGGRISLSGSATYLGGDALYGPAGTVTAGGDINVTASDKALLKGSISTDGSLTASGTNGIMFGQFNTPGAITVNAKGALTLTSVNGSIGVNDTSIAVALQSNSDGIGTEALTLNALSGIDLPIGSILAGTGGQSDLQIRLGGGALHLSSIQARSILSAQTPNGALVDGLIIPNGSVNFTGSVSLTSGLTAKAMNFEQHGPMTLANGNLDIQAWNAVIIGGAINANDVLVRVGGSGNVGNLFITPGTSFTGHNVALSSGSFYNTAGAGIMHISGHWVVYSSDPFGDTFGGLDSGNTALWNATLSTRDPSTISGNRYVFAYQPTLTFSSLNATKVYGTDLTGSTGLPFDVSGYQPGVAGAFLGDTGTTAYSGLPSFTSSGFATRASVTAPRSIITIGQGGLQSNNGYAFAFSSAGILTITPKALTADVIANNKTYDGVTTGTGTVTLNGVLAGDVVGTTGTTFTFSDKTAGTGKTVAIANTALTGADAGNYTFTIPASVFADILKKALTAGVVANNKTYDGTRTGTGSVMLNGVVAGDVVGTSGTTFTFADKNAGTGKTVAIAGTTLTGADAGNYTFTIPASAVADILKKTLTANVTANNKTYDGTTAGTGTVALNGVIAGDVVGTGGTTFTFSDKSAGARKSVTTAGTTLTGADAGNYTLTISGPLFADILKKAITGGVTVDNKTYDGTAAGTGTVMLNGVVAGDAVGTSGTTFTFSDKNAGVGKTVAVAGTTLTGGDAGNYTLTIPASALGDILKKALTANVTVNAKTYDGTTLGTGTVTLNGVVAGDAVSTSGTTFTFADKNAGTGKAVTVAGTSLTGVDAGNYMLTIPASALADILKKAITANVVANNKTYDGTTAATGDVTLSGVVNGDTVGTTGTTFNFSDKNAGTGKAVAVAGTTLTGTDAGNYTLTVPASVFADILKKTIAASVVANGKTYDGTTAGAGTVTLNGVVSGDAVGTAGTTFTFADKNAGTGKTVTVAGTTLTGADAGNYTVTVPAAALADILRKAITASVVANNKTYDGTATGTGTVTLNGVVAGDAVSTNGTTFTFSDKNAGTGKTVTVAGTTLTGMDAGNYTVTVPANALADILKKALTANVVAGNKTYDGTTSGTGTVTLNGVVSGDTVGTSGTTFTFADKNAGTGKTVNVTGTTLTGADAGNYTVTVPASALADILKKAITASVAVTSKTYDGTTAGTGTVTLNGVVSGDNVTTSGTTFIYADKNAGTGKAVVVAGTTVGGADAGNYTVTIPASALGDILKRALSVTADDASKVQNDPDPALTYTLTSGSLVGGDAFSGNVSRDTGENPGTYAIKIGTLNAGDNYTITFTPGTFTINLPLGSEGLQPALKAQPLPSQIGTGSSSGSSVNLDTSVVCGDDKNCTTGNPAN